MAWPFDGNGLFGNSIIPFIGQGSPFGGFSGGTGGGFGTGWGGSIFGGNPGWPGLGSPLIGQGQAQAPVGTRPQAYGQMSQPANQNWGGITMWPGPGNLPQTGNNLWPTNMPAPPQARMVPNPAPAHANLGMPFSPLAVTPSARPLDRFSVDTMAPPAQVAAPAPGGQYGALRTSGGVGTGPFGQRQQYNNGQGWQNVPLPPAPQTPQAMPQGYGNQMSFQGQAQGAMPSGPMNTQTPWSQGWNFGRQ